MSKFFVETLKSCAVAFDIDGVLAQYEFGNCRHYAENWEDSFDKEGETPYDAAKPVPIFKQFIEEIGVENAYVCSSGKEYEAESKAAFAEREYGIPKEHIFIVPSKKDKVEGLIKIQKMVGDKPVAIVDDSADVLDIVHDAHKGFITAHVSSFLF